MTLEVGDLEDIYIITKNTMTTQVETHMSKADMLTALDNNKNQMKPTCFMIKMASLSKKDQEEVWKDLESMKFKNEDDFITRIRWNVSSTDIGSYL